MNLSRHEKLLLDFAIMEGTIDLEKPNDEEDDKAIAALAANAGKVPGSEDFDDLKGAFKKEVMQRRKEEEPDPEEEPPVEDSDPGVPSDQTTKDLPDDADGSVDQLPAEDSDADEPVDKEETLDPQPIDQQDLGVSGKAEDDDSDDDDDKEETLDPRPIDQKDLGTSVKSEKSEQKVSRLEARQVVELVLKGKQPRQVVESILRNR